jgi:hypothetical protein
MPRKIIKKPKADVIKIDSIDDLVYIILGIDANEHDQVLAVCHSYDDAKQYCLQYLRQTEYYDLWIEKHVIL